MTNLGDCFMLGGYRYFCLCVASMLCLAAHAQRRKVDSLLALIPQRSDTEKVIIYIKLASGYKRINIDTAVLYANRALQISKKHKFLRGEYDAVYKLSDYHKDKGNFTEALSYMQRSLEIGMSLSDSLGIAQSYNAFGNIYNKKGEYQHALNYFLKSLAIKERLGDKDGMANTYLNIGTIYNNLYAYTKAELYFTKGINLKNELKDYYRVAGGLNNLSIIYANTSQVAKAIETLERILKEYSKYIDPYLETAVLGNLAENYQKEGRLDKALEAAKKSLQIRLDLGDSSEAIYGYVTLANIQTDMKNYPGAVASASQALKTGLRLSMLTQVWDSHVALAEAYAGLGESKKSLYHYREAVKLTDTLSNARATELIHEMEARYESDRKEAEITKLNDQKKISELELEKKESDLSRQRWIMIFGAALFVILVAFSVLVYRSYREKKRSNERLQKAYTTIAEKQKEILDSIYYARRIQRSLLPTEKYILKKLDRIREQ